MKSKNWGVDVVELKKTEMLKICIVDWILWEREVENWQCSQWSAAAIRNKEMHFILPHTGNMYYIQEEDVEFRRR